MSWLDSYLQWDTAIRSTVLFVVGAIEDCMREHGPAAVEAYAIPRQEAT
jgi:hypothetical protein